MSSVLAEYDRDFKLFINNDIEVRKHFKLSITILKNCFKDTFTHYDKKKHSGITLKIYKDEYTNKLIYQDAYNMMKEIYYKPL